MPIKILIVGGGYAGFYTAWKLEKHLKRKDVEVSLVDPLPYMTYLPFLPEVAAGSIEPRHALVGHRRHLRKTRLINSRVTAIDHAQRKATIQPEDGNSWVMSYDHIVVTAGSVSRTFPIPGVAEECLGIKSIQEAVAIRDRLVLNYEKASALPEGPERQRLLTVTVVGGGFAGIETVGELRSLATSYVKRSGGQIHFSETRFHLIEAMARIMPEVSLDNSKWVIDNLEGRGVKVHLETQLKSCVDGMVELSTDQKYASGLIIWTAGVMANPGVVRGSDLPVEQRGRIQVRADLRVGDNENPVLGAWAAGDVAAVPDLSGDGVGGMCVPNAQHAVRQAKRLAKNLILTLDNKEPQPYFHKNKGAVAGIGLGIGVLQTPRSSARGLRGWLAHRAYHGMAMPTWERKWRVIFGWGLNFFLSRDDLALRHLEDPKKFFQTWASRPKN